MLCDENVVKSSLLNIALFVGETVSFVGFLLPRLVLIPKPASSKLFSSRVSNYVPHK